MARVEFEPGAKMRRLGKNVDNPTAALKQIGVMLVADSQQAFRHQKHGKEKWKPRSVPNVYGIVADFHAGRKAPPARRFQGRPALVDTGRLRSSIAFRMIGTKAVEVGSSLPYAGTMHAGGPIQSETITERVQDAIHKWLSNQGRRWRKQLGFLLNRKFTGKRLKGKVEARPFVGLTERTARDIEEVIGVKVFEVGRR